MNIRKDKSKFMLKILYEDNDIIVCEKPIGTASQNERGFAADMVSILMTYLKESGNKNPYVGVIHRLDKMVGGIMVYAKTKKAAANLCAQGAENKIQKHYYALLSGVPEQTSGKLEDYIVTDHTTRKAKIVSDGVKGAKKAELDYQIKEMVTIKNQYGEIKTYPMVEVNLVTGRFHQIRVQFASRGCPLLGDRKYNEKPQPFAAGDGVGLFSCYLEFIHPVTGKCMRFETMPQTGIFSKIVRE